jgi:hypothetical protein
MSIMPSQDDDSMTMLSVQVTWFDSNFDNRHIVICYHLVISTVMLYHHLVICTVRLWLPNEGLGRKNKRWNAEFRSVFQGREYSIWATNHWKGLRKSGFHLSFILPKYSFGEHKVRQIDIRLWEYLSLRCCFVPTERKLSSLRSAFGRSCWLSLKIWNDPGGWPTPSSVKFCKWYL